MVPTLSLIVMVAAVSIAAQQATLVSDFLMIRWPGEAAWFGFRDVAMVDGKPVRDRDERLVKLFTENSRNVFERADLIAAESARHNIGDVFRNINVPTQALDFLHPRGMAWIRPQQLRAPDFGLRARNAA